MESAQLSSSTANSAATQFKTDVIKWRQLNMQINHKNAELRDMRKEKAEYDKRILAYLEEQHATHRPIRIGTEEIVVATKRDYAALSFSYIEDCLSTLLDDRDNVQTIMDYIYDNREMRETQYLKHVSFQSEP